MNKTLGARLGTISIPWALVIGGELFIAVMAVTKGFFIVITVPLLVLVVPALIVGKIETRRAIAAGVDPAEVQKFASSSSSALPSSSVPLVSP